MLEKNFSRLETILVAYTVPSELIEVIQPLVCHIVKELPGSNFIEKSSDVQLGPQRCPRSHPDASLANSLENEEFF